MTKPELKYDVVALMTDKRPDVVEALFASGHSRYCNYVYVVDEATGLIYCKTCLSQIGNIHDNIIKGRFVI